MAWLTYDTVNDDTKTMYQKIREAIQHAIDTVLPVVKRKRGITRKVPERTKALYDQRTKMTGSPQEYKQIQ